MEAPKTSVQRPRRSALRKAPGELLPARVQKSYFMLSSAKRDLLNTALEKFRPGRHEPVLVGGLNRLKTALKLMGVYPLVIEEVQDSRAITSYTRWIEALQVNEAEDQVYVTFSPRFEHLWLELRKRLLKHAASNPAKTKLRGRLSPTALQLGSEVAAFDSRNLLAVASGSSLKGIPQSVPSARAASPPLGGVTEQSRLDAWIPLAAVLE